MKTRHVLVAGILAACGLPIGVATGQNLAFMPGDAFFCSSLIEADLNAFAKTPGRISVKYNYPPDSGDLSGYAGFGAIDIDGIDTKLLQRLRFVYRKLRGNRKIIELVTRDDGTRTETEVDGCLLFVCNRSVDWRTEKLGLRYNESWPTLDPKISWFFGEWDIAPRSYRPFFKDYDAVVEDWRNAREVPGLKVDLPPKVDWAVTRSEPLDERIGAHAKDLQFVVLGESDPSALIDYFRRREGAAFYRITTDAVHLLRWTADGSLEEEAFPESTVMAVGKEPGSTKKVSRQE